jgi:pyruvate dehydrogenase E2 component (dihydrolipoamide acetyltransferase)
MRGARLSGWRRIADAIWRAPSDPQIYGLLEIDATALLAFMADARAAGHHVTPTHLVGRALAHALVEAPDLNVRLSHGRAIPRPSIDIFFITAVSGGRDLSGVKIERADQRSVQEIARELTARVQRLRDGDDPRFEASKRLGGRLPRPLLRLGLRLGAYLAGDLALSIRALGLDASPFGSAMVTSVGMLGLPVGFAPLAWMYRVPILVLVGEITPKPVAVDGRVEVRPILPITITLDHRYADGWHIGRALAPFKDYLADPAGHEAPNVDEERMPLESERRVA